VTHGLRDPRVPPSETAALVAALRAGGQHVETVLFDHCRARLQPAGDHRPHRYRVMLDFLPGIS